MKENLIIYQMGRVGSTAIWRSLKRINSGKKFKIFHTHSLNKNVLNVLEEKYLSVDNNIENFSQIKNNVGIYINDISERYDAKRIKKTLNKDYIITVVRDPISQTISRYFRFYSFLGISAKSIRKNKTINKSTSKRNKDNISVNRLIELFVNYLDIESKVSWPLIWFDIELKQIFDIDVYKNKFEFEKGYAIYENEKVKVLLLRFEDLHNNGTTDIMNIFLNIDNFKLINVKGARSNCIYKRYNKFINLVNIPKSILKSYYNSKYMKHFYTDGEIKRFTKKWNK